MIARVNRRHFIASAAAAAGAVALPARVFAQPSGLDAGSMQILEIARREVARAGDVLWRRDIAGVADFGLHSAVPRFHFANLENGTVSSYRVAHGSGSDPEHTGLLHWFSNQPGSNASSNGAFLTSELYIGQHGRSQRLIGLEPSNDRALDRAIVIHGAAYVDPALIAAQGRIGRSQGCFAFEQGEVARVMERLGEGRLIYAGKAA